MPSSWTHQMLLMIFMFVFIVLHSIPCSATGVTRKLHQTLVPQGPDAGMKCGSCSCGNPCDEQMSPPPPPPPYPPPPPPPTTCCFPNPTSPPPPKTTCCFANPTSPPPPRFIYVNGIPENVYVIDSNGWGYYNGVGRKLVSSLNLVCFMVLDLLLTIW